jgi:hypothetical protein
LPSGSVYFKESMLPYMPPSSRGFGSADFLRDGLPEALFPPEALPLILLAPRIVEFRSRRASPIDRRRAPSQNEVRPPVPVPEVPPR